MATELDLDDVAAQSDKAKRELKELRDTLNAVSDALDYLHGMTPQQAADTRKDALRYRWLRVNWFSISAMTSHGGHAMNLDVTGGWPGDPSDNERLDTAIDDAMAAR